MICIAGGTGIAPILSILRTSLPVISCPVYLYFGMRNERDIYLQNELKQMVSMFPNLRVQFVVSDECTPELGSQVNLRHGLVTDAVIQDFDHLTDFKVYTAGSPEMVQIVLEIADRLGVHNRDVHADPFYAAEK